MCLLLDILPHLPEYENRIRFCAENRDQASLQARGEFERVRAKPLGDGFVGVPVTEGRIALLRHFFEDRLEVGVDIFVASGYTGQTTEVLALTGDPAPTERIVGVRLPSSVSLSVTWNLRPRRPGY